MREIKFRAKALDELYGLLELGLNEIGNWDESCDVFYVKATPDIPCLISTIVQFTGLKDKNGKGDEVYKDDIVSSFNGVNYLVYYDTEYGQWWGRIINKTKGKYTQPLCEILDNSYMHITGNAHQNPELLEQDNG